MSRQLFEIEKGLHIVGENGWSGVSYIFGADAPGLLQSEIDAEVGSVYNRTNGEQYIKIAAGTGTDKWRKKLTTDDLLQISPRSEKVIVATGDVAPVSGNTIDLVAAPFSDDEGTLMTGASFAVGNHVLFGVGGVPKLMKVSVVAGDVITLVDADDALSDNDYFIVQNYLPDSPADQELQAIIQYYGGAVYKLGDVNWAFANGINLAAGYSANAGNVASGDSVQEAISKLDGVNDAQDLALGLAQAAVNFGAFTGGLLSSNASAKSLFQEIETEVEAIRSLSGTTIGQTDLGAFTGNIIPDGSDIKEALQAIETSIESESVHKKLTGITTEVSVDELLVDAFQVSKWEVYISLDSAPERAVAFEILAAHNGHSLADATTIEDTVFSKLKFGPSFSYTLSVDLNGTGAAQVMRLRLLAPASVTVKVRRIGVKA